MQQDNPVRSCLKDLAVVATAAALQTTNCLPCMLAAAPASEVNLF